MSWWAKSSETSTSAGYRNAATCATEFLTTEIARSYWPLRASTSPTTFSTALPAMATTTRPGEGLRHAELVDRRAQRGDEPVRDEGRAHAAGGQQRDETPSATRVARALVRLARGLAAHVGHDPRQVDQQQRDRGDRRDRALVLGGRLVGAMSDPDDDDDEARDQQQRRGVVGQPRRRSASMPSGELRAPTTITRPSTSSALANSEPMIDVCATTTSPARRAKTTTKNSGRLPSVDCSTPVAAGPKRSPTCSVASETRWARPASATRGHREGEQRRASPRSGRSPPAPSRGRSRR